MAIGGGEGGGGGIGVATGGGACVPRHAPTLMEYGKDEWIKLFQEAGSAFDTLDIDSCGGACVGRGVLEIRNSRGCRNACSPSCTLAGPTLKRCYGGRECVGRVTAEGGGGGEMGERGGRGCSV